jgi:lactoylglutathione lyase
MIGDEHLFETSDVGEREYGMHFGYTIVYVADVKATAAFYAKAFGFRVRFNADDWDYAELETGDTTLAFAALHMADVLGFQINAASPDAPAPGIELAFVTANVQEAYDTAVQAGSGEVTAPQQTPWGQTVSYVRDMNGVLIEICSPVGG